MSGKPFDATTKFLIDTGPRDWLALAGVILPVSAIIEPVDVDLSTITADADRLLRVTGVPAPCIYHIELQSSHDARLDERVHWYNTLARYEYQLPVYSVAFLLRRDAGGAGTTGAIQETNAEHHLSFRYALIRVWQLSASTLRDGALATLPMAPLAARNRREAANLVQAVHTRLDREVDLNRARELSAATFNLLGLRYNDDFIETLTKGVQKLRESSFYQMILREGRAEGRTEGRDEGRTEGRVQEAREMLLRLGTRRYGAPPTSEQNDRIAAEISRAQLEVWLLSLLDALSWDAVFQRGDDNAGDADTR